MQVYLELGPPLLTRGPLLRLYRTTFQCARKKTVSFLHFSVKSRRLKRKGDPKALSTFLFCFFLFAGNSLTQKWWSFHSWETLMFQNSVSESSYRIRSYLFPLRSHLYFFVCSPKTILQFPRGTTQTPVSGACTCRTSSTSAFPLPLQRTYLLLCVYDGAHPGRKTTARYSFFFLIFCASDVLPPKNSSSTLT